MIIYKEMEYTTEKTREILAEGNMFGLQYYIVSYGTHPCCYIKIPKGHELFGIDYRDYYDKDICVNCHGGITFSSDHLFDGLDDGWYIGWDYSHLGDYHAKVEPWGRKYTVSVLVADVTEVICDL